MIDINRGTAHPGYPEGWRIYLRIRRKADDHFRRYPEGTVKPEWHRTCTKEQWRRECLKSLHDRINTRAGETWRNDTTLRDTNYRRDQRMLHDWIRHRGILRGSGFAELKMRRRFPDYQERMTEPDY